MNRKFLSYLIISLLVIGIGNSYAQKSQVTYSMATKIGAYCQYNQRALSLFAMANPEQVQNRTDLADRLLSELPKHLDCAENFIIALYYNYGKEMAYFALKDAGFTVQETDKAEAIWAKEQKRQEVLAEKRKKGEEQEKARREAEKKIVLRKRAYKNELFQKDEVVKPAKINWDSITPLYEDYVSVLFTNVPDRRMYYVTIDKDGALTADKNDTLFINQYVMSALEQSKHTPAVTVIKEDTVPVKTEMGLKSCSIPYECTITVKKNKKGEMELRDYYGNQTIAFQVFDLLGSDDEYSALPNNKQYSVQATITTHCIANRLIVQETLVQVYSKSPMSYNFVLKRHYPFSDYKVLNTSKIKVVYAE